MEGSKQRLWQPGIINGGPFVLQAVLQSGGVLSVTACFICVCKLAVCILGVLRGRECKVPVYDC